MLEIERRLYIEVREAIARRRRRGFVRPRPGSSAQLDVLVNFARIAGARNYTRPEFTETSLSHASGDGARRGNLLIALWTPSGRSSGCSISGASASCPTIFTSMTSRSFCC